MPFLFTQDEITCFRILQTRRKREVAFIRHVSALRKNGDLVFHGWDAFPSCFRFGNERSCFRHISVITFPFFLVSVTFQLTFFFLTHVQYRMINVSATFPLRTIKVNKGKFTLKIGPLNGSHAFFVHVALMQRL